MRGNGERIGPQNLPTSSVAGGVWNLLNQQRAQQRGAWPSATPAVVTDPYFMYVPLLLETGASSTRSTTVLDGAATPNTVTRIGTPSTGWTGPVSGGYAGYFPGNSSYLSIGATSAFNFGTGAFSIESWFNVGNYNNPGFQHIISINQYTNGILVRPGNLANEIQVFIGGTAYLFSISLSTNVWYNLAVTRSASGSLKCFVNGTQIGSTLSSTYNIISNSSNTIASAVHATSENLIGYLGSMRVSNIERTISGIATAPYTSDANTVLLLNLADSNYTSATNGVQNNTFIDSSNYAWPITRNGTPTQGSFTPYQPSGYWSGYFASSYLSVADSSSLRFGSGNFTIEAWVFRTASGATHTIACKGASTPTGWVFQISSADKLVFIDTSTSITGSTSIAANTWTYVAVVRSGTGSSQTTLYINGASDGTGTSGTTFNQTDAMRIGTDRSATNSFAGYISNLRLSNTNLTISNQTAPLSVIGSTIFYSLGYNRFVDGSTLASAITVGTGTPSVQAFQPFAPAASYSAATYGGSGYFNGSTDYLSLADNTALQLSTGDFTIEGWFYISGATSTAYNLISKGAASTGWSLNTTTGARIQFSYTSSNLTGATTTLVQNVWYHIAVVRSGRASGNLKIYLNGVQEIASSGAVTDDFNQTSTMYVSASRTATVPLNGYSSNIRVVKGTAIYTAAFTPPTTPLTAVSGTSLLTNFTNAGIYDAAWQNNALTVGDAQASTTQYKWSPTSMKFDGTGDYLTMPLNAGTTITSGNFTVEFWLYPSTVAPAYQAIVGTRDGDTASTQNWSVYLLYNQLTFEASNSSNSYIGSISHQTTLSTNTWYYCALVRSGSTFTLYLNGVAGTSTITSSATIQQSGTTFYVGKFGSGSAISALNGYIQDLRITKGVARTITTPTAAFPTR